MNYLGINDLGRKIGVFKGIMTLVGIVLFFVVGTALAPTVANQAAAATTAQNANITAPASALFSLSILFYAIILVVGGLGALSALT